MNEAGTVISNSDFVREYYQWLCDLIHINQRDRTYWLLAKALHKKEFYWTVPNDDNRAQDGRRLRDQFAADMDYYCFDELNGPCSMLEMLIGMAKRIEHALTDPDVDDHDRTADWFWELLGNAGLDKFTDDAYIDLNGILEVDAILNRILDRTYKRDGRGGLFPQKNPKKDQRKVELWYQMSTYLVDKYYSPDKYL